MTESTLSKRDKKWTTFRSCVHRNVQINGQQKSAQVVDLHGKVLCPLNANLRVCQDKRSRIYNTFDAHRLLHWAHLAGAGVQMALKKALLKAYFTDGEDPSNHAVLIRIAGEVGLDPAQAKVILDGDTYAEAVRAQEQFYLQQGINSVPAVVINGRHLISGGQPPEAFEQALRQIAAAG